MKGFAEKCWLKLPEAFLKLITTGGHFQTIAAEETVGGMAGGIHEGKYGKHSWSFHMLPEVSLIRLP